jgi:hypothetical protein
MIGHIFKYKIQKIGEIVEIEMPVNAKICDINCQGNELFLWAMVDIHAPLEKTRFVVYGTGWKIDNAENLYFIKTVHTPDGFVWHVFSVIDDE